MLSLHYGFRAMGAMTLRQKRRRRIMKVVINQIIGRLRLPKNEVIYLENIFFQTLEAFFTHKGVFFTKVIKANIIAFKKQKI